MPQPGCLISAIAAAGGFTVICYSLSLWELSSLSDGQRTPAFTL